jgi:hypothetical protein
MVGLDRTRNHLKMTSLVHGHICHGLAIKPLQSFVFYSSTDLSLKYLKRDKTPGNFQQLKDHVHFIQVHENELEILVAYV